MHRAVASRTVMHAVATFIYIRPKIYEMCDFSFPSVPHVHLNALCVALSAPPDLAAAVDHLSWICCHPAFAVGVTSHLTELTVLLLRSHMASDLTAYYSASSAAIIDTQAAWT